MTLQNEINKVSGWMDGNKLLLNQKNTKVMLFGTRPRAVARALRVTKFTYLGIIFDHCMTWQKHADKINCAEHE